MQQAVQASNLTIILHVSVLAYCKSVQRSTYCWTVDSVCCWYQLQNHEI